jgi:CDGSH-type Zn-finger protein
LFNFIYQLYCASQQKSSIFFVYLTVVNSHSKEIMMLELLGLLVIVGVGYWTYHSINQQVERDIAKHESTDTTSPAPVLTQQVSCGCGRSSTGFCVGLHKLSEEEWAVHADNPNKKKTRKPRAKKDAA